MGNKPVKEISWNWMETFSGTKFNLVDIDPASFTLADIARSLSMSCRYKGHVHTFYSVAEHCVLLARHAIDQGKNWQEVLTVLLHDAAEAYIGDMVRPAKDQMPQFKDLESRIDAALAVRYNLIYPFPPFLKEWDFRILIDEQFQAMIPSENDWGFGDAPPMGIKLQFWEQSVAEQEFIQLFAFIQRQLKAEGFVGI